ncbi:MAG: M91 family zinc metallopeptidase [Acetobacteraceae bacterium]|nr:M91 family zinc metallopeptidase [Acetobacteraceae bacterium]
MNNAKNGTGTVSAIKWDPASTETPDGARPPYIALAHELIHCMHNLKGTSYMTGIGDVKVDEMMVTGLKGYEQQPVSENRIREEHGVHYRSSYHGQCSAAEGAPDVNAF